MICITERNQLQICDYIAQMQIDMYGIENQIGCTCGS